MDAGILKGMDAQVFLTELCRRFRQLLTAHLCGPDADLLKTTPDEAAQLHASALKFTLPHLERCLTILMRAESDTRYSASPRGVLEVALLRACDRVQEHDLSALQEQVSELTVRLRELVCVCSSHRRTRITRRNRRLRKRRDLSPCRRPRI